MPQEVKDEKFTFVLNSFRITDTRSRHKDSDYVSFTLLVQSENSNAAPTTLKKSMGDLNNGTYHVNLDFSRIAVKPGEKAVINYLIINSGHKSESKIYSTLESTGAKLATSGGTAAAGALAGSVIIPVLGTAIGALAGFFAGEISGLLDADCDGVVAAEQNTFSYEDLLAKTVNGAFKHETKHPGTDSPHGCGGNSMYYVDWEIKRG